MEQGIIDWDNEWLTLSEDGPKCRATAVLSGVSVKGLPITYGPLTLRPLDGESSEPGYTSQRAKLVLQYIDRKDASSMYIEPMEVMIRAFRSLQLLVDNWVGSSMAHHIDIDSGKDFGISGSHMYELADTPEYDPAAVLTPETSPTLELFASVFAVQRGPFDNFFPSLGSVLGHPLERFSRACTEIKHESILDFVIALEGTLGFELDSEIAHRLSARGAILLTDDSKKRVAYYKAFKYLYTIRSKIVHQGEYNFSDNKLPKEALTILGYNFDKWDAGLPYKAHVIADIARKISRDTLLLFVSRPNLLNPQMLLDVELGAIPKE